MKIIFEGTEEQIYNLKLVMSDRGNLPKEVYPLQMWSEEDVLSNYECTKTEAISVIEEALNGEYISSEIWNCIRNIADDAGLIKKEEEE